MTKIIPLTRGKFALADDDDYEWLSHWKWFCSAKGYAVRNEGKRPNRKTIYMHCEIMKPPAGMDVDHIHGMTLDNRKSEMRICNRSGNKSNSKIRSDNTCGFKGVNWSKFHGKWVARVGINGRRKHIGYFDDPIQAAVAYDKAAAEIQGEFARMNFPHAN